ncbi:hypothetical protein QC761_602785 [Podospora bellae-mahoneyi]|uniref:Uncharacterized protein n=1 Tax=Podospora bellae-mahoneyi TaxID=2093777 RepID=A0ABR0FBH5_9PEZI|nr:hypothetical protein QC761_602785 [Podospora bellae-mahoneyi]
MDILAIRELDKLDLEKGLFIQEVTSSDGSPTSNTETLNSSDFPFREAGGDDSGEQPFVRTQIAEERQGCREWLFFPACKAQFSFILDHWAAKSKETFQEVKELEQENRAQGQDGYKKCLMKNAFGRKKQELVDRLTMECKELAFAQPDHDRGLDPENSGFGLLPKGYRSLGPRPSAIDNFVVSTAEIMSKAGCSVKVILF